MSVVVSPGEPHRVRLSRPIYLPETLAAKSGIHIFSRIGAVDLTKHECVIIVSVSACGLRGSDDPEHSEIRVVFSVPSFGCKLYALWYHHFIKDFVKIGSV